MFSFFWSGFCTQELQMICTMDFDLFFGILIFDPQWGPCMGYSLCMMANFQNGLIYQIFSVFWGCFCTEKLEIICRIDFDTFFGILIFDTKWWFSMRYIAFAWWQIFKMVLFREYLVYLAVVFCTEQLEMICRMDFDTFSGILIFDAKWGFCMGYTLCMMANFQNGLISRICNVFWSGFFTQNNSKWFAEWILTCFYEILLFPLKWAFCIGYSLCMTSDFQNGLILEYLFFWSGFCTEKLEIICRIDFYTFFGICIFDRKWGFCMG